MNNKNRLVAIISVSIFITVIIGFIFVYIFKNGDRRNYKDTSKWQITITYRELNIREEASTDSQILGKVSQGEVYDVIDYTQDATYYWYKITTKEGITGYVGSKIDDAYVKESGAIKKSDLSIKYYHNYAIFKDDTYNTDEVECTSTYGCIITYELLADNYIKYIATDTLGKSVYKTQKYYMTYSIKGYTKEIERCYMDPSYCRLFILDSKRKTYEISKELKKRRNSKEYSAILKQVNSIIRELDNQELELVNMVKQKDNYKVYIKEMEDNG